MSVVVEIVTESLWLFNCFVAFNLYPSKGGHSHSCWEQKCIPALLHPSKMAVKSFLDYVDVCIDFQAAYSLSKEAFVFEVIRKSQGLWAVMY